MRKWWPAMALALAAAVIYLYWTSSGPRGSPVDAERELEAPDAAVAHLHDADPVVRERAARALGRALHAREGQTGSPEIITSLVDALHRERKPRVRNVVIWALGQGNGESAPALLEALRAVNRNRFQRVPSFFTMAGPGRAALLAAMVAAQVDDVQFTQTVGSCLGRVATSRLALLQEALSGPDGGAVRAGAALAVGILGSQAPDAVLWLRPLLGEEEDLVGSQVCLGMALLGRPGVLALREALQDPNPTTRAHAALGLSIRLDEDATEYVLDSKELASREQAASAERKNAIPALKETMRDRSAPVRLYSILALLRIDPESEGETKLVLRQLANDADPLVRYQAAGILLRLQPGLYAR